MKNFVVSRHGDPHRPEVVKVADIRSVRLSVSVAGQIGDGSRK